MIYSDGSSLIQLSLAPGKYVSSFIDPQSGKLTQDKTIINGGKMVELKNAPAGDVVIWIKKSGK